jgi:hypothetical protein
MFRRWKISSSSLRFQIRFTSSTTNTNFIESLKQKLKIEEEKEEQEEEQQQQQQANLVPKEEKKHLRNFLREPLVEKQEKIFDRILSEDLHRNALHFRSPQSNFIPSTSQLQSSNENQSDSAFEIESIAWDSSATVDDYRNLVRNLICVSDERVWSVVFARVKKNSDQIDEKMTKLTSLLKEYHEVRDEIRSLLVEFKNETVKSKNHNNDNDQETTREKVVVEVSSQNDLLPEFKISTYGSPGELPKMRGKRAEEAFREKKKYFFEK